MSADSSERPGRGPAAPAPTERSAADRLDSWKEIAAHLKRDVRTVQRWEKEHGLPVMRHVNARQGSVFAYREDLDRWWNARRPELEDQAVSSAGALRRLTRNRGAWAALGGLAVIAGVAVTAMRTAPSVLPRAVALSVVLEPDLFLDITPGGSKLALSADGMQLAFVGRTTGSPRIHVRRLDRFETRVLPDTENALALFFSPDGRSIGFLTADGVKRVSLDGGPAATVCRVAGVEGGSAWLADGDIVFGGGPGLLRVSSDGGVPRAVTWVRGDEMIHEGPVVLPGGRLILFNVFLSGARGYESRIEAQPLDSAERHTILRDAELIGYVPGAGLIFYRGDRVMRVRFDPLRQAVVGDAAPVLESADDVVVTGEGTLAYTPGPGRQREHGLVWVDLHGGERPIDAPPRPYTEPAISPDGLRVATKIFDGHNGQIWIYDLARSALMPLTTSGSNRLPFWNRDGSLVVFHASGTTAAGNGGFVTMAQPADRSRPPALLTSACSGGSFTSDGSALFCAGETKDSATSLDILMVPNGGHGTPQTFLRAPSIQASPRVSPDDRWLAYVSDETGRWEVYVTSLPIPRQRWQISTNGGGEIAWGRDGRTLFFRANGKMMAATIEASPGSALVPHAPVALFDDVYVPNFPALPNFDVAADGGHLLMIKGERSDRVAEIRVLQRWWNR